MQLQAFIFCGGGHNLSPFSSSTLGEFNDNVEQSGLKDTSNTNSNPTDTTAPISATTNIDIDTKIRTKTTSSNSSGNNDTAKNDDIVNMDFNLDFDINDSIITATGHLPKALLPVANRFMIEYVIDWCDQADFHEINIVAHKDEIDIIKFGLSEFLKLRYEQYKIIESNLHSHTNNNGGSGNNNNHNHYSNGGSNLKVEHLKKINFIPTRSASMGQILINELLPLIKMDFVLLPCDFITDIPPQIFLDQYNNRDDDNLAMSIFYQNALDSTLDKKKMKKDQIFTVYNNDFDHQEVQKQPILLDIYSNENVTKTKYLQIRSHLLWKYPNITVSTKLLNSSIYFCSYELCQFLKKPRKQHHNDHSNSVNHNNHNNNNTNGDTSLTDNNNLDIGNINDLNSQNSSSNNNIDNENNTHKNKNNGDNNGDDDDNSQNRNSYAINPSYFKHNNNLLIPDSINTNTTLSKLFRDLARRSWRHVKEKRETVGIFILPDPSLATFIRSNNLSTLMDANRFVLKIKSTTSSLIASSSAIGADALVDPSVILGEKSSVKLSTIRNNCIIGKKCRISGSIILDGAVIEDECILENVIVGPNVRIGAKSKLTNSYVEGNYVVEPKSMTKGETLMKIIEDENEFDEDGYAIYNRSDYEVDHLSSDAIYSSSDDDSADDYYHNSDDSFDDDGDDAHDFFER